MRSISRSREVSANAAPGQPIHLVACCSLERPSSAVTKPPEDFVILFAPTVTGRRFETFITVLNMTPPWTIYSKRFPSRATGKRFFRLPASSASLGAPATPCKPHPRGYAETTGASPDAGGRGGFFAPAHGRSSMPLRKQGLASIELLGAATVDVLQPSYALSGR